MSIEAWWPNLKPSSRDWLIDNNGDAVPVEVVDDIVALRQEWNDAPEDRFGHVAGYRGATRRLAAPPLPADLRLKRRFRRGRQ